MYLYLCIEKQPCTGHPPQHQLSVGNSAHSLKPRYTSWKYQQVVGRQGIQAVLILKHSDKAPDYPGHLNPNLLVSVTLPPSQRPHTSHLKTKVVISYIESEAILEQLIFDRIGIFAADKFYIINFLHHEAWKLLGSEMLEFMTWLFIRLLLKLDSLSQR